MTKNESGIKFFSNIKRAFRKIKYLDKTQASYFVVTSFIAVFMMFTGVTYSYFTYSKHMNAAVITIANLNYTLESSDSNFKNLSTTVPANSKVFLDLDLKSLNTEKTKYALDYKTQNSGVRVFYSENLKKNTTGIIGPNGSVIEMRLVLENTSNEEATVNFEVKGGYIKNTLTSNINDGYFENDLTIRTVLYDEEFLNANSGLTFPDKEKYSFYKVECSNGVIGTFDEDTWSLKRNDEAKQTSCDVYFKKSTEELELYYSIKGSSDTEIISKNKPDTNGLYKYTGVKCSSSVKYTFNENTFDFNVTDYKKNALCIANFETDKELESAERRLIAFDANGGKSTLTSKYINIGGTYGTLPIATRSNNLFMGWFTDPYAGVQITSDTAFTDESVNKLYAHWQEMPQVDVTLASLKKNAASLNSTQDNYGTSYYWNSASKDNYISFANLYWRIVRINGDGSIRMIYDGTKPHDNGEVDEDRIADYSKWNDSANDVKYAGYMFGGEKDTPSSDLETVMTNLNDSLVKAKLDKWYEKNIVNRGYANGVADAYFCGDRSIANGSLGYGSLDTIYAPSNRVNTNTPSLVCSSKSDIYTTKNTELGNASLKYPIGLLTIDEALLAGNIDNADNFLYRGKHYWTMSPNGYTDDAARIISVGNASVVNIPVNEESALVPVINLNSEYASLITGTGTKEDVYRIG